MRKLLISAFLVLLFFNGYSQDHIYSQFYNSPNYLNPALNGQFQGDLRVNFIYRSQWTNLPGPLNYYSFSVDYSVPKFGGGFGLLATRSTEGSAPEKKTNLSGIYSYSVHWDNSVLSFGLQAGVTQRKIDAGKLYFANQLDENGVVGGGVVIDELAYNSKFFFDTGAGVNLVFFNAMIGASAQHINRPSESYTGRKSLLDMRMNLHASYRFNLDYYDDETSPVLIPSVVVYKQKESLSVSSGVQFKTRRVSIGAWYRGETKQPDAVVLSLSLDVFDRRDSYDKIRVGYSHDATASRIKYGETSGSTEGALTWESVFPNRNSDSEGRSNYGKRCYDFY